MNTWGISSGDFLVLYVALLGGAAGIAYALRRRAVRDRDELWTEQDLKACDVVLLNEGPQLALATAAAGLRDQGALAVDPDGALVVSGPLPTGAHPLERWLYGQVTDGDRLRVWPLRRAPVLREGRNRLRELGLVPTRRQLAFVRLQSFWLLPLVVLGLARVDAESANERAPVGSTRGPCCPRRRSRPQSPVARRRAAAAERRARGSGRPLERHSRASRCRDRA
jgi:uncharacterized protein (TIGR04222 family)